MNNKQAVTDVVAQNLRSLLDYIAERGRVDQFNMDFWWEIVRDRETCQTTYCLAGFKCEMDGVIPRPAAPGFSSNLTTTDQWAPIYAGKALGLLMNQPNDLFYVYRWPLRFKVSYRAATTPEDRFAITRERVEYFIKTGA